MTLHRTRRELHSLHALRARTLVASLASLFVYFSGSAIVRHTRWTPTRP